MLRFRKNELGRYHSGWCIWEFLEYVSWTWSRLFSYCTRISMESSLKKIKLKLHLITGTDILLMVGKGIRKRICHAIHRYARANKKYMKGYDRNKESSYLKHWNANNLYGWEMSRSCLEMVLSELKINLNLIKISNTTTKIVMKGIFLKLMFSILKNYISFTMMHL